MNKILEKIRSLGWLLAFISFACMMFLIAYDYNDSKKQSSAYSKLQKQQKDTNVQALTPYYEEETLLKDKLSKLQESKLEKIHQVNEQDKERKELQRQEHNLEQKEKELLDEFLIKRKKLHNEDNSVVNDMLKIEAFKEKKK